MSTDTQKSEAVQFLEQHFGVDNAWDLWYEINESKIVKEEDHDEHRWFTIYNNVHEVGGRFFTSFSISHKSEMQGDRDVVDESWIYSSIKEVFPHEVTTVIYK